MTKLQSNSYIVGIDVSKQNLDAYIPDLGKTKRFANKEYGLKALVESLSQERVRVVMESTGGLEHLALKYLTKRGHKVSVVNPRNVRRLAQGLGMLAKTDKIDARLLSCYGEIVKPLETKPKTKREEVLAQYVGRRRQLSLMKVQEKNRRSSSEGEMKENIDRMLRFIDREIEKLEKKISKLIEEDEELSIKHKLLKSVKGVGDNTASQLLSEIPELGKIENKKLAALAGVAPFNCDSGKLKGQRRIWGGRITVRNALYMVALVAIKHNRQIQDFYECLCARGKPKKVALVACMRKLLAMMNAILRDNKPWQENLSIC